MAKLSRILIPTDFSPACDRALARAAAIAAAAGAELHVVHVQVLHPQTYGRAALPSIDEIVEVVTDLCRKDLEQSVCNIQTPVVTDVIQHLKEAPAIVHYAEERAIDLIVMGTQARKGVSRMFLGSVAAEVLRRAPVSVMVIGADHELRTGGYRRVLAPVDFSENSTLALQQASAIAHRHRASLVALHVVEPPRAVPYIGMVRSVEELRQGASESLDRLLDATALPQAPERRLVRTGPPDAEIVSFCREEEIDLIVMGTVGLSGLDRVLLGSTTERVLRNAPCAVLVQRGAVLDNL